MARAGRFEDTSIYARPDGGGLRMFRVTCAVTGRVERGCAAPAAAKRMLRELGWTYNPRVGWVSPEGTAAAAR
jgi:hypothetical protein